MGQVALEVKGLIQVWILILDKHSNIGCHYRDRLLQKMLKILSKYYHIKFIILIYLQFFTGNSWLVMDSTTVPILMEVLVALHQTVFKMQHKLETTGLYLLIPECKHML